MCFCGLFNSSGRDMISLQFSTWCFVFTCSGVDGWMEGMVMIYDG